MRYYEDLHEISFVTRSSSLSFLRKIFWRFYFKIFNSSKNLRISSKNFSPKFFWDLLKSNLQKIFEDYIPTIRSISLLWIARRLLEVSKKKFTWDLMIFGSWAVEITYHTVFWVFCKDFFIYFNAISVTALELWSKSIMKICKTFIMFSKETILKIVSCIFKIILLKNSFWFRV